MVVELWVGTGIPIIVGSHVKVHKDIYALGNLWRGSSLPSILGQAGGNHCQKAPFFSIILCY